MLLFCPTCANTLTISRTEPNPPDHPSGRNLVRCRTCPFEWFLDRTYFDKKKFTPKKVDAAVVAEEEEKGGDVADIQCPRPGCEGTEANFYQVQIRSADEPMTSFYRCMKCKHKWRED